MLGRLKSLLRAGPRSAPRSAMPPIAVIDDEPDILAIVTSSLRAAGYAVVTAPDGVAGLEVIRLQRPWLSIIDIKMPRMNGYDLIEVLRRTPGCEGLRIIVMTSLTADQSRTDEDWRQSLGIHGFLSKPFSPARMVGLVDSLAGEANCLPAGAQPAR